MGKRQKARGGPRRSKPTKKKHKQPQNGEQKNKNLKFIQRSKATEDFHKRQKILEDKYREEALSSTRFNGNLVEPIYDYDDVQENEDEKVLETLMKPLVENGTDDDDDDDDDDDNDDDSVRAESEDESDYVVEEEQKPIDKSKPAREACKPSKKTKSIFLIGEQDTFASHLDYELTSEQVELLVASTAETMKLKVLWPSLKTLIVEVKRSTNLSSATSIETFYLTERENEMKIELEDELKLIGVKQALAKNTPLPFSGLQTEMFTIMNNYQDLYFPERSFHNCEELRIVYSLHALNHMMKTRSRVIHHNAKLNDSKDKIAIVPDSYRDQGLTRPKILFVLPTRNAAYRVLNTIIQLFQGDNAEKSKTNGTIINYERFESEFTGNELYFPKTNPKPEDFEKTFCGNTDDNFRIGMSMTKKCLKLYTDFYGSDILMASPLGLRTIIGAQSSKDRDFDFLNSIELLIIDQAELIVAQNWENLLHLMEHMHLPPQSLRDTDFQRVRPWYLNGYARFYRQTLLFASHELPEFRAIFNNKCFNYEGKVRACNPIEGGDIRNIIVPISQLFHRIHVTNMDTLFDDRFKYFTQEILPKFRSTSFAHCMIYIPSYFDYVRLRNYFKEETISCVQICEYTKKEKIARARDIFFHSGAHFILYSERAHFFRRTRIKGIRHLIMYQLPQFPHFFSEIINLMHDSNQNRRDGLESSRSITVLYSKYDVLQLGAIVGTKKATDLISSTRTIHSFTAS